MRASIIIALSSLSLTVLGCSKVTKVTHTFYGYPDNDPAGESTSNLAIKPRVYPMLTIRQVQQPLTTVAVASRLAARAPTPIP